MTGAQMMEDGYERLSENLWRKGDECAYVADGERRNARMLTKAEAAKHGVDLTKLPPGKPSAEPRVGLEKYAVKVANLNDLTGEHYDQARGIVEKTDEALVEAEIRGEVITQFVYKFPSGGRDVIGLTYAGVREIAKRVGRIAVEDMDIQSHPESYIVVCRAKNLDNEVTMMGVAEQSKFLVRRDGKKDTDPFALQKASSKAQRNAIRALIPEVQAVVLLKRWLADAGHTRNGKT